MITLPTLTLLLMLITFFGVGFCVAWLYSRNRQADAYIERETVKAEYVHRPLHDQLQASVDGLRDDLHECENGRGKLREQLAALTTREATLRERCEELNQERLHLQTQASDLRTRLQEITIEHRTALTAKEQIDERLTQQNSEVIRLQQQSAVHFEQTAEKLLREKGQWMTDRNKEQIDHLLTPIHQRLHEFNTQLNQRFQEQTDNTVSLRAAVEGLQTLNNKLSTEANNLASALRGDSKTQGDWGEWQLLRLLEASGLYEGVHFETQVSFEDADKRQKRPDFIINLPDGKHLVLDSKVSLTAYDKYCSCPEHDADNRRIHASEHLNSLRRHVRDLHSKNYTDLHQIHSPDYLLLFVPIEPALSLALNEDRNLFTHALERNIVMVTASTLLATLRTVSYIWKQEKQKANVQEIAKQGGMLYDKVVAFTEDMETVGKRLDQARDSYNAAFNKLSKSPKHGGTILGKAELLRVLGAKNKKNLSKRLVQLAQRSAMEEE